MALEEEKDRARLLEDIEDQGMALTFIFKTS